jgi:hypothetical protein
VASLRRRFVAAAKLSSSDEVVNQLAVPNPLLVTAVRRATSAHSKAAPLAIAISCRLAPSRPAPPGSCVANIDNSGWSLHGARGLLETDRLREVLGDRHRWHAVRGHLHELAGDLPAAATAYVEAARRATNVAERDHLAVRPPARGPPSCRKVVSLSVLHANSGTQDHHP